MRTIPLLLALAMAGCGTPDPCGKNPSLCEDGGSHDAGQGTCTGQCVMPPEFGFPMLLWSGPEGATPPACPEVATPGRFTGYLDAPPSTVTCSPACTCSPSGGTCFPSGTMVANSAACPASGASVQHAPFNAPKIWDGTCTAMDPVSSADSLTVDAPGVSGGDQCSPSNTGVQEFKGGTTISLRCNALGNLAGVCPSLGQVCTYPNVPGFSVCFQGDGDLPCPATMPKKHLLFERAESCTCSCGAPVGESCSASVTAYEDGACSKPLGSVTATSDQPAACVDVSPSSALGSKSAVVTYKAGTCTPTLTKSPTMTLCCLP